MLVRELREIIKNKPLAIGIGALLLGQLLYGAWGIGALFFVSTVYVLVVGVPFPAIVRSVLSRTVLSILLVFGFVQLAAVVQFYVARTSEFNILSLLTTLLILVAVCIAYRYRPSEKTIWFDRKDAGAVVAAAFFVVPLMLWCAAPARITSFGGLQSPDGASHNAGINEMGSAEHLTYRTNPNYYPKGYHIAEALELHSFHLLQRDQSWSVNTRVYVAQYVAWGFVVAFLAYYVAYQLAAWLMKKLTRSAELLLAVLLGSTLSLFYLLPFAQEGFLNYYYICAAFIAGLLFLPAFELKTKADHWLVTAYFLGAFGITASWGPLLLPALAITPLLAMVMPIASLKDARKQFLKRRYVTVIVGFAALLVPLYIHIKYSHSTSFNAEGSIRVFNIGIVLAGVALLAYAAWSDKLSRDAKRFIGSVFWPYILLVAGLAAAQYLTVGAPRYYTIKTSYLFEMIVMIVLAALALQIIVRSRMAEIQKWLFGIVVFCVGIFMLMSLGGNPITSDRAMFFNRPAHLKTDTQKMTTLGEQGELHGHNNAVLHYNAEKKIIYGNELIANWANGLSPNNDGNAESAECNGVIYSTLTYGSGTKSEQEKLIKALKKCIDLRTKAGKKYYIITDPDSQPYLKRILGGKAIFL